jgi:glycosyltransferase involved in cell wall biosynthesis
MTLVSVLLPVHNGARYLESATRSILNQTHREFELIVVDDGSTDGSGEMVTALRDSRARVIRNERNLGLPASLNRGLREARAEIVARQDADDLSHPQRLEAQVRFLEENPGVGLVGTQAWLIDEDGHCQGSIEHAREHESLVWELLFDNAFIHSSVAFRRDVIARHGGYDENSAYNEDYDLWVKVALTARLRNLPERLVAWRSHEASKTRLTSSKAADANRRILAENLSRLIGAAPAEVVELLVLAQQGMKTFDLLRLLPLVDEWAGKYRTSLGPDVRDDFERALARQYLRLAFTRRHRGPARVVRALWAGRRQGTELTGMLLALAVERLRLTLGYDPIVDFNDRR